MRIEANSPDDYIAQLPDDRKVAMSALRKVIRANIPSGFEETMSYGMIGYVVPHSIYPAGYHSEPKLPLPFMNIASQKNWISVYHSVIYSDSEIYNWFVAEFPKYSKAKLDIGKCCIRFKKVDQIPFELIGELAGKVTPEEWIEIYENNIKNK